jgi:malate permease and related proteins
MIVLISALAPVILIIIIGYIANYQLKIEPKTLSILTISVLTPALITDSLSHSQVSLHSAKSLIIGFLITSLLLYGLVLLIGTCLTFDAHFQKTLVATTLFSNNGNLGLPFLTFALGEQALERGLIYMIIATAVMAIFGPALLKGEGLNQGLKLTLKMPLLWATLMGIFFKITAFSLPFNLENGIKLLGEAAIPTALLLLGIQLARGHHSWGKSEILACTLRLLISPMVSILVANWLQLKGVDFQVLVLQGAMPTAVNTYVWVNEFGGDAALTARIIIVSTLISFITLPLFLMMVNPV